MPSLYSVSILPIVRGLKNAIAILKYAESYAEKNNVDFQTYLDGRLHPDMANLPYQVYRFTDAARFAATRISGCEPLSQPDEQVTLPDLVARIEETIAYLEKLTPDQFEGKDDKEVVLNVGGPNGTRVEIKFTAVEYLNYYALPNFWFHITTMYGIFRSKGVDVGKMLYLNGAGIVQGTPIVKEEGARG